MRSSRGADPKKTLMRLSIFAVVAFMLFQIQAAGDPVQMYMQVVGDVVSPAMVFSEDGDGSGDMLIEDVQGTSGDAQAESAAGALQSVTVFLRTDPAEAGLRVWQDDINLGIVPAEGKSFVVKPQRLLLDARGLGGGIKAELYYLGNKYVIDMTEEIKAFDFGV